MKKISLLFGVFLDLNAQAQKFTTGFQVNYVHYKISGVENTSTTDNLPYWEKVSDVKASGFNMNGTLGYNPVFYQFDRDLSIGASANVGLGYILTPKFDGLNGSVVLDLPEYLTIRYGKNATNKSREDVGYAFGLGWDYTLNALPFQGPSIMAEVSIEGYAFRLNTNLLKYTYYYYFTSEGDKPAAYVWPIGLQVLIKI